MKKNFIPILAFVLIAFPLWLSALKGNRLPVLSAVANIGVVNTFANATNSNIACKNGVSTLIISSTTNVNGPNARLSFAASNSTGTSVISVCEGDTCAVNTGITLAVNGAATYQLLDNYAGSISCIGDTATSTLSYTFANF